MILAAGMAIVFGYFAAGLFFNLLVIDKELTLGQRFYLLCLWPEFIGRPKQ